MATMITVMPEANIAMLKKGGYVTMDLKPPPIPVKQYVAMASTLKDKRNAMTEIKSQVMAETNSEL